MERFNPLFKKNTIDLHKKLNKLSETATKSSNPETATSFDASGFTNVLIGEAGKPKFEALASLKDRLVIPMIQKK